MMKKEARDERMANPDHLAKLKEGVEVWNQWRREYRDIQPNLRGARLYGAELQGANLYGADLQEARLVKANLQGARLYRTKLQGANLSETDLQHADLDETNLQHASLRDAVFDVGTRLRNTVLGDGQTGCV